MTPWLRLLPATAHAGRAAAISACRGIATAAGGSGVRQRKWDEHWTGRPGATVDEFKEIFKRNKEWADSMTRENSDYFKDLSAEQRPRFLWIGCADARVPANEITGLQPGEVFVHRNVANLVVNTDSNINSVLQFAIEHLKVPDIIVCGHYNCGGVNASLQIAEKGTYLDSWIVSIRDVQRTYQEELDAIADPRLKADRLVELNVIEQLVNLLKNPIVQKSQNKYGYPRLHAMVYRLEDGILKELDANLKGYVAKYKNIYSLYDFDPVKHRNNRKAFGGAEHARLVQEKEKQLKAEEELKIQAMELLQANYYRNTKPPTTKNPKATPTTSDNHKPSRK